MAKVLGKKTRAVIELTGKMSLRLFKRGWPLMRILVAALYGVLASIPGWIAWRITRRLARFAYGPLHPPSHSLTIKFLHGRKVAVHDDARGGLIPAAAIFDLLGIPGSERNVFLCCRDLDDKGDGGDGFGDCASRGL